jgi:hypothetical protein
MKKIKSKKVELKGYEEYDFILTEKIDGIQVIVKDGEALTRAGKPIYGVPDDLPDGKYEAFYKSFKDTVSTMRSHNAKPLHKDCFYMLEPFIDTRIIVRYGRTSELAISEIFLDFTKSKGVEFEGFMMYERIKDTDIFQMYKYKTSENHDVPVTSIQPGTGKNLGKMGALVTPMGKVGTGFTDAQREEFNSMELGTLIEVECMSVTENGKFRHPRFVKVRWDK